MLLAGIQGFSFSFSPTEPPPSECYHRPQTLGYFRMVVSVPPRPPSECYSSETAQKRRLRGLQNAIDSLKINILHTNRQNCDKSGAVGEAQPAGTGQQVTHPSGFAPRTRSYTQPPKPLSFAKSSVARQRNYLIPLPEAAEPTRRRSSINHFWKTGNF